MMELTFETYWHDVAPALQDSPQPYHEIICTGELREKDLERS
jgi:hypothetical protein